MFEQNDYVRIIDKPPIQDSSWVNDMDKTCGTIGQIVAVDKGHDAKYYYLLSNGFYYTKECLALAKPQKQKLKINLSGK